jgi:hypothetical protein
MAEGNRLLYEQLKKDKLYTKSYEEFSSQFSTPEKLYTLYTTMKSDGFYTKPIEEFKTKYWTAPKTTISIKDTREKDMVTDTAMTDRNRMHSEVDTNTIRRIAEKAKEYGVDPYTALAIGIQETGLSPDYADNPFRLFDMVKTQEDLNRMDADPIEFSMQKIYEQFEWGKSRGKKTDEDIIQAWNGYGPLRANTENIKDKAYGIDISKEPIYMDKNPVYGKRVKDIRDNILKKNPEVVKIINSFLSPSLK